MNMRAWVWRFATLVLICGLAEAHGPHASLGDRAKILDNLVGTWDVEYTDFLKDGTVKRASGEFVVGWVLDGYAVQDTYTIQPEEPGKDRYISTTLNYLDPKAGDSKTGTWHAVFIDPAHDYVATFTGVVERPDRIVFRSQPVRGTELRWSRIDIRPDSFTQREEESTDAGQTWRVTAEHHMTRRKAS